MADIVVGKTNPRRTFDGLDELANSIREKGVLEPIIVRPAAKGDRYELVCGERRVRATKLAGISTIPAIARQLTDAQAVEIQIIENNQRADVHPIEEADGIKALIGLGMSRADVAVKLGRPEAYVAQRLKLADLTKDWKKLGFDGSLRLGQLIEIAKLTPAQQGDLFNSMKRDWNFPKSIPDPARLRAEIQRAHQIDLSSAPWKLKDASLVPEAGSCQTCMKRTGADKALFDDGGADRCLDTKCFKRKQDAFVELRIVDLKKDGAKPILICSGYQAKKPPGTKYSYEVTEISERDARKLKAGEWQHAIFVDGDRAGHTFKVRVGSDEEQKQTDRADNYEKRQKAAQERARRETELNTRILKKAVSNVTIDGIDDPQAVMTLRVIAGEVFSRWWNEHKKQVCARRGWQKPKGATYGTDWMQKHAVEFLDRGGAKEAVELLLDCALTSHVKVNHYDGAGSSKTGMKKIAELLGVDVDSIASELKAELAEKAKSAKTKKRGKRVDPRTRS